MCENNFNVEMKMASVCRSDAQKIINELDKIKHEDVKTVQIIVSSEEKEPRYIIVHKDTGVILDTNGGYGYTTDEKAYRAFAYKTRDVSKDIEKEIIKKEILNWLDENAEFEKLMIYEYLMIVPKSAETGIKFNTAYLRKRLKDEGIKVENFKIGDLFKIWLDKNFDD